MHHLSLLTQVESPQNIRAHFDWHRQQRVPLRLMSVFSEGPVSAVLMDSEDDDTSLNVMCTGMGELSQDTHAAYAVIGTTPGGANFLASGLIWAQAGTQDCFKLSFPQWIDVSQSRDCFRCPTPSGHSLHFSALDPHLNDIVCRVKNVSLGGLAVEWDSLDGAPPALDSITDAAILETQENRIYLGRLRVVHITRRAQSCVIGLNFERSVPNEFTPMVLSAQRAQYLR